MEDGLKLTILAQERPWLNDTRFSGNNKYSSSELLAKLTSQTGERLDERKLFEDSQQIERWYRAGGYPQATLKYSMTIEDKLVARASLSKSPKALESAAPA